MARARFEHGARQEFPALRGHATGRKLTDKVVYSVTVPVPEYGFERVTITLYNSYEPAFGGVTVTGPQGPNASPHRYAGERLCMWFPNDPPEKRWVGADGLLALVRYVQIHLFKEAWWRETGEWLGDEVGHGSLTSKEESP